MQQDATECSRTHATARQQQQHGADVAERKEAAALGQKQQMHRGTSAAADDVFFPAAYASWPAQEVRGVIGGRMFYANRAESARQAMQPRENLPLSWCWLTSERTSRCLSQCWWYVGAHCQTRCLLGFHCCVRQLLIYYREFIVVTCVRVGSPAMSFIRWTRQRTKLRI